MEVGTEKSIGSPWDVIGSYVMYETKNPKNTKKKRG